MERMINKRLIWYLEHNCKINMCQSGFRKHRSTMDNLSLLESEISESFASKKYLMAIFFDLEKAYDRVWRRKIIQVLLKHGIIGNMTLFIQNFLKDRKISSINGTPISSEKSVESGVPQGSVLSVTLFILVINSIFKEIKSPAKCMLYADDLVIYLSIKRLEKIQKHMQYTINKLSIWCNQTGFHFSPDKTSAMIFSKKNKTITLPSINISNPTIQFVNKQKFLGMIFDHRLN